MKNRASSLVFKFGMLFLMFTIVTLLVSGVLTYYNQMKSYRRQCVDEIKALGVYLEEMMKAEGEDFVMYQNFYVEHYDEIDIPYDFDEYQTAWKNYDKLFRQQYPGKTLGEDIQLSELTKEVQKAYLIYRHEYWLLTFEQARESFQIPYTYYLLPSQEDHTIVYMIDGERTRKKDGKEQFLYLGDTYYNPPEKYPVEWKTWETGERQNQFQEWNNAWGHTYSYYVPLIINGRKMGLIGTEVDVTTVNKGILKNTFKQLGVIGVSLIVCVFFLLCFIERVYISRIEKLTLDVEQYAKEKDESVATQIDNKNKGRDELSVLAAQFANMIRELEAHMTNLVETTKELAATKQLANRDALTGIRNKTAYDEEIQRLEEELTIEPVECGIAMIDLNFLKRINDEHGHERGNIMIKKLCMMVCHIFDHSPVFRVGGDEFVVILKGNDYHHIQELQEKFYQQMEQMAQDDSLEPWEKVSAAIGIAFYDVDTDSSMSDVFERADQSMYENKRAMKAKRQ